MFWCAAQQALCINRATACPPCLPRLPAPPAAGYSKKIKGKTAEERLDMRAAMKTDKFCK